MSKIVVVKIRGFVKVKKEFLDTLKMLNLNKKYSCVVVDTRPDVMGMIKKVKDFVTWGEIDDSVLKSLEEQKKGNAYVLHPPRGGFEYRGTKMPFNKGGALGYRGDKINDLLARMI